MHGYRQAAFVSALLLARAAFAQERQFAQLGDFKLESGERRGIAGSDTGRWAN
jgi:hypothetical protein